MGAVSSAGRRRLLTGTSLWLTADGLLCEAPTEAGRGFATTAGSAPLAWYLFFSDLNGFGYLAGSDAVFRWA